MLRKRADIVSEDGFRQADKFIAMDTAIMFQAIFNIDLNLSEQAVIFAINRSANNGGKTRVDQNLTAYDNKNPIFFRITG